jgi:beta-galactosidase
MKDPEAYTSPKVTTWKGRAMLVVRSTPKSGKINIGVKSSLPTAGEEVISYK